MYICKICGKEYNDLNKLGGHLQMKHSISTLIYYVKYENFKIPVCKICGSAARYKSGLTFRKTCGDKKCIAAHSRLLSHSLETKALLREKRLKYLKENPEKTAWRLGNKMSWPEKFFHDACIRSGLDSEYEIIREKSEFPYFIDFAFDNVKVAIEIDGSQHLQRIDNDTKKDNHLISKGWRVYRIPASKLYSENDSDLVINDVKEFLKNYEKTSDICGIKTHKEWKTESKILSKNKQVSHRTKEIERRKNIILNCDIDFSSRGWVEKVSMLTGMIHQKVTKWMKKYMIDFYEERCLKRKRKQQCAGMPLVF